MNRPLPTVADVTATATYDIGTDQLVDIWLEVLTIKRTTESGGQTIHPTIFIRAAATLGRPLVPLSVKYGVT